MLCLLCEVGGRVRGCIRSDGIASGGSWVSAFSCLPLWGKYVLLEAILLLGTAPYVDLNQLPPENRVAIANYHQRDFMMPAVCSASELQRLQRETRLLARANGANAWGVAKTMFCGTSDASRRYLKRHMPRKVLLVDLLAGSVAAAGDELVESNYVPMLRGSAWDVRVARENKKLVFEYKINDLCVGSFGLRYVHQSWLLVQTAETCF